MIMTLNFPINQTSLNNIKYDLEDILHQMINLTKTALLVESEVGREPTINLNKTIGKVTRIEKKDEIIEFEVEELNPLIRGYKYLAFKGLGIPKEDGTIDHYRLISLIATNNYKANGGEIRTK